MDPQPEDLAIYFNYFKNTKMVKVPIRLGETFVIQQIRQDPLAYLRRKIWKRFLMY